MKLLELEGRIETLEKEMEPNRVVQFKKLHPDAIPPKYQRDGDAGFDFCALVDGTDYLVIDPGKQKLIRTGIACSIPEGYEIQIRPRSGLALKKGITITNSPGTIDSGYTIPNEIKVILHNLSDEPFKVSHGDRIAQGVLASVSQAIFSEVQEVSEDDMVRNRGGGFGSTGK